MRDFTVPHHISRSFRAAQRILHRQYHTNINIHPPGSLAFIDSPSSASTYRSLRTSRRLCCICCRVKVSVVQKQHGALADLRFSRPPNLGVKRRLYSAFYYHEQLLHRVEEQLSRWTSRSLPDCLRSQGVRVQEQHGTLQGLRSSRHTDLGVAGCPHPTFYQPRRSIHEQKVN